MGGLIWRRVKFREDKEGCVCVFWVNSCFLSGQVGLIKFFKEIYRKYYDRFEMCILILGKLLIRFWIFNGRNRFYFCFLLWKVVVETQSRLVKYRNLFIEIIYCDLGSVLVLSRDFAFSMEGRQVNRFIYFCCVIEC